MFLAWLLRIKLPILKLDGTLQSIITVKLGNSVSCQTYEPPESVLVKAKSSTMEYNRAHGNAT